MNPVEPKSGLETGVWFDNSDFIKYRGQLPIAIQGDRIGPFPKAETVALSGCTGCQLSRLAGIKTKRWMILPP